MTERTWRRVVLERMKNLMTSIGIFATYQIAKCKNMYGKEIDYKWLYKRRVIHTPPKGYNINITPAFIKLNTANA